MKSLEIILIITGAALAYRLPSWIARSNHSSKFIHSSAKVWMGAIFLFLAFLSWLEWGSSIEFYLSLFCLWIFLMISLTDQWFGLIPNRVTYPACLLLFIVRWFVYLESPLYHYLAMVLGGITLFLLVMLTRGMGMGDVKLFALGGLVVGWPDIWLAFWLATISGTVYIVYRYLIGSPLGRKTPFPFGPHLCIGIYSTYLWGDHVFMVLSYLVDHMLVSTEF